MSFNFKGVEAAKANSYLRPGYYRTRISGVESGEFEQSGIPYLAITFATQDGLSLTEKFVLKTKDPKSKFNPLSRLQYLHQAWLGEELDQQFKSLDAITEYFAEALAVKTVKTIVIGGEINGKVTYGRLPLTDFVIDEKVELGAFDEDSDEYKQYVRKSTRTTEAAGKKGGLLNSDDDDSFGNDDDDDNEPEEQVAPKSKAKAPVAKEKAPAAKTKAKAGESFDW